MHLDIDVVGGREEDAGPAETGVELSDKRRQDEAAHRGTDGEAFLFKLRHWENGRINFYLSIPDVLIYRHNHDILCTRKVITRKTVN